MVSQKYLHSIGICHWHRLGGGANKHLHMSCGDFINHMNLLGYFNHALTNEPCTKNNVVHLVSLSVSSSLSFPILSLACSLVPVIVYFLHIKNMCQQTSLHSVHTALIGIEPKWAQSTHSDKQPGNCYP